jgi:hypothetical protein
LPDLEEQISNEGFCLLRLCRDLTDVVRLSQAKKTYLYESERFLQYICDSLKAIDEYIAHAVCEKIDASLLKAKLREFDLIKKGLSWLYVLSELLHS